MHTTDEQTTQSRARTRLVALRLLAQAFPGRVAGIAGLALLTGALPAVFALLVARLVTILPAVVTHGFASADGRHLVNLLMVLGGVLLAQEIMAALRGLAANDLYRRYDEYLLARVMRTILTVPRLELFEDPVLAAKTDRAVRIARFGPGELVSGLMSKWSVQAQGLAATLLVATVWPVAAVALAGVWLLVGRQLQADYYRANPF